MIFRIPEWETTFENASSRKLKRLDWVAVPNKTDGEGYTALVDHPNAAAHLGAWYAIVEAASKQTPRGCLPRGIPNTLQGICRSLARMSRLSAEIFEEVLPRLLEIGWLEKVAESADALADSPNVLADSADGAAESPEAVAESAAIVAAHRRELQGITGNDTHTHAPIPFTQPKPPRVTDLPGQTSARFEEFWNRYPRKQRRDFAAMQWNSLVTTDNEAAVFACLDRYLLSDEVARGVVANPDKWLYEQHRGNWQGTWPRARDSPATAAQRRQQEWDRVCSEVFRGDDKGSQSAV